MYWDINKILPYQRNFNFINGERSLGKSYGTQKYVIKKCLQNEQEFIYIVRTQDEKKSGVLKEAFAKVIANEFPNVPFKFSNDIVSSVHGTLGYCIALSEALKIKKKSYPRVKYLIFDEYMLESSDSSKYVHGWKEPDLLLSIYHTADREEDRIICFMLGNNTSFYNPYHMHPAFNIPETPKGSIWTGDNVLFQWAVSDDELKSKKSESKFLNMISSSEYGNYAKEGNYIYDNPEFIEKHERTAKYYCTIKHMGKDYGLYYDMNKGKIYVSNKIDPSCTFCYAFTLDDHSPNTLLLSAKITHIQFLIRALKLGRVFYESMQIKTEFAEVVRFLL